MSDIYNTYDRMSGSELERLVCLCGELGEAIQAINKAIQHGYSVRGTNEHGVLTEYDNRSDIATELGHVLCHINNLVNAGDIAYDDICISMRHKEMTLHKWQHFQTT